MKAQSVVKTHHSHYRQVAAHFSKAARSYEEAAQLQKQIGNELLQLINLKQSPEIILDLGCSTGYLAPQLHNLFPMAQLLLLDASMEMLTEAKNKNASALLCANMEELPFSSHSIDLVFANMSLQWSSNFSANLFEIQRILKAGGSLLFSIPGPLSLIELKHSWKAVDSAAHVNPFPSSLSTQQELQDLGFKQIKVYDKLYQLEYPNVRSIMQNLKATGADYVLQQRHTLTGKTKFKQMMQHYEQLRNEKQVLPCTYEIIFGQAQL